MEFIHDINLVFHIGSGFTALLTGLVPMVVQKGSKIHKRWGWVYYWAMFGVFLTSIVSFLLRPTYPFFQFLMFVGLFSFHLTLTGTRALRFKKETVPVQRLDWIIAGLAIVFGAGMFLLGLWTLSKSVWAQQPFSFLGILYLFFGGSLFTTGRADWRFFSGQLSPSPKSWFFNHLIRMVGAYIATVTAFFVVNMTILPWFIVWFTPGLVGGIGISYWIRHYRSKFGLS